MADSSDDQHIAIDDGTDSAYGDDHDAASETTSLRSAIYTHVYENGRRYHSYMAGLYWLVAFPLSSIRHCSSVLSY